MNKTLQGILKEKQNKKWLKYQKRRYKELLPERPRADNGKTSRSGFGGGGLNNSNQSARGFR